MSERAEYRSLLIFLLLFASREKVKNKNDQLMITESKNIAACYSSICWYYKSIDLPDSRKYIQSSLMAANCKKQWKDGPPADLIYFYEDFTKLYNATTHLAAAGCKRQAAIIDEAIDIDDCSNTSLFCDAHNKTESRLWMPVYLSPKEYCNPYKALKKAVRFIEKINEDDELFDMIINMLYHTTALTNLMWSGMC
ncbi:hypothetical protein [Parafilimonas sp.]|uniref:hypothetical protein n=1 Tax=Parafilimonas sp. TaxID=1969739 RepID=UPI003F7E88E6